MASIAILFAIGLTALFFVRMPARS